MDKKQELIKSISENAKDALEFSRSYQKSMREYEGFIESEALNNIFAGDDEGFVSDIASQVILNLSEKPDLEGFFKKVKEIKEGMDNIKNKCNELNQKGFLMLKQAEEFSVENMDIDIIRIAMTRHPRWHKVKNDLEELTSENNMPFTFAEGYGYVAVSSLNDVSPKEYLMSLLKKSETKGNFLKAVVSDDNATVKLPKDELKTYVISNNQLLSLKNIQSSPIGFEKDISKAIEEKVEKKSSIKNKV